MIEPRGLLSISKILDGLSLERIGTRVELVEQTGSSNDYVWAVAEEGASDGYVVFTEHQTCGRGRLGRTWLMPRGAGVMLSLLLLDDAHHRNPPPETVSILVGIAVTRAIRSSADVDARVSWPNDVYVGRRKLAGVLTEMRTLRNGSRAYVIGLGVNCLQTADHFPPELRTRATSLDLETSSPVVRERVAAELLRELDRCFGDASRWTPEFVRKSFHELTVPLGACVQLTHAGRDYRGRTIDIDPTTAIVIELDEGGRMSFPASGTALLYEPADTDA